MIPTVGRIIHVGYPGASGPCRAAIVAGIDYNPSRIYAAVFDAHHAGAPVHNAVVNADDRYAWHDPRECPDITAPEYASISQDDPVVPHGD